MLLGDCAGLSPIDITIGSDEEEFEPIELLNLDYYRDFAIDCRLRIERALQQESFLWGESSPPTSDVEARLLVEMVRQVSALSVGHLFRNRTITGEYARVLLRDYLLRGQPDAATRLHQIIEPFLFQAPSHHFHVDFHIALSNGLPVTEMEVDESDLAREIVSYLNGLSQAG